MNFVIWYPNTEKRCVKHEKECFIWYPNTERWYIKHKKECFIWYPNTSLRSRRLEVVGTRKNVRARRRHARGEGAPARKAPEHRFPPPLQLPGSRCVICQTFWQKTSDLAQTKRAAKKRCTFYLRSKYICYKDQLGYLIIKRWSNKLMVNTQL